MSWWKSSPKMKMDITFGPDLNMLFKTMDGYLVDVKEEAFRTAKEHLRKMAEKFRDRLREYIEYQEGLWTPLSEEYLMRKIANGLDWRTLIATGEYVDSIYIDERETPGMLLISVSVPDRDHKKSNGQPGGINLRLLARYLEYGTSQMPPRPHWRPVVEAFIDEHENIDESFLKNLLQNLRNILRRR